jgi:CRP-like cAMP-binding protein
MTTLKDLRDLAQHRLETGDATGALKVFRLVLEGEPLDFSTRLKIADCLLVLGEARLAGAVYTAVAVFGIKAGAPLQALVAIKMLSRSLPQDAAKLAAGLQHDLAVLYCKDSPCLGRGARAAPIDLSSKVVRDGLDLDYPMPGEELRRSTAQMAAYTDNITNFPERLPPVPIFSGLGAEALERVVSVLELRRYSDGELIVRQGEPGESFFVVTQGLVRIFRERDGVQQELARLGEGSILGEMAVLSAEPRAASAAAVGDVGLLIFSRAALAAVADELPQVGQLLERYAVERMVRNLLNTSPFFEPFNEKQRHDLLKRFEAHKVQKGTVMVRQGEEGRGIYLILHGTAEVARTEPDGASLKLAQLGAGDCFGEIACIQEKPTTARVSALSDATVMFLPREVFNRLVAAIPALSDYYTNLSVERLLETKRAAEAHRHADDDGFIRF